MSKRKLTGSMGLVASASVALMLAASAHASTIAYWRFEEGKPGQTASGSILDSSGNGLNGTPSNGPVYQSSVDNNPIPQTGAANTESLAFNGSSQSVLIPDNPLFQLAHSLTIEADINLQGIPDTNWFHYIVFRGDDRIGLDPFFLSVYQTSGGINMVDFNVTNASNSGINVTATVPALNQWAHVAATLDDATGQMDLYLNGTLASSTTTSIRPFGLLTGANPGLGIGGTQDAVTNQHFDGLIDEVRISDVALQPNQFLSATVPEPSTICIGLVGSGFVMLRRRGQGAA